MSRDVVRVVMACAAIGLIACSTQGDDDSANGQPPAAGAGGTAAGGTGTMTGPIGSGGTLEEVASRLCYATVPSFARAFRRWTGSAPAEYRARQRGHSS